MVRNSLPRLLLSSAIVFGLSGFGASAASAAVRNRIVESAARGGEVAIPDTVQPRARLGSDLGPTAGNTRLQGMTIRFNMTPSQEAALNQLLADQQNPESPRYHQWLTPDQFGTQFGLSSADLATVSAWLTSQGFTVTGIANGGTYISFDGTVAQADAAFGTSIHNLSVNGATHFANVTNISVPSAFAGVVTTVMGLHNFRLKPHVNLKPSFTSSVSGNHYIAPGDIYAIYNMEPLLTGGINGAGIGTGANCHSMNSLPCGDIAVIGRVDINSADVLAFRTASGLSTTNLPTTVHAYGYDPGAACTLANQSLCPGPTQGDLAESSIDVEWSGAMAPAANIMFVNGQDVIPYAIDWAINFNLAPIITSSYGLCEAGWGTNELLTMNAEFKQANSQGQTILSASADQGAADCDAGPSATEGLQVDFPGSSPYVTSVGGTMFNEGTATGATNYWLGTDGTFVAGTSVTGATYSATGYIPEAVWNDVSYGAFGGSGGGASAFFTKPTWQVGTGVPADAARDEPDISFNASDAHDSLLFCVNVALGTSCGNGYRVSLSNNNLEAEGGTSFDSQIFGGMLALVEQKIGGRVGNANQTIYALANSHFYAAGQNTLTNSAVVFNDVTSGNNAMSCTAGSSSCGNGGTEGYNAGTGFDLATGWGSVNVANLANDWAGVTPLGVGTLGSNTSTTNLTTSSGSVTAGTTVTLTATVTGSAGTPTGTVTFLANNVALSSPVALPASGIVTYAWVTSCAALGQQVMSASYSGDVNYQGSIGPVLTAGGAPQTSSGSTTTSPLTVQVATNACPDFSITPSTTSVSVAAGGIIPAVTITAAPINNFTGTVTFSALSTSTSGYAPTFTFSSTTLTLPSSSATTSLTLSGITAALHIPNAPGQRSSEHAPWYVAGSGVTIASLLLLVFPRRRRLGGLLLVALAVALVGGATGCGGSSQTTQSTATTSTNPYAGTYTVTVIGTYTSSNNQVTQHSTVVTYSIQ
jgi:subtilase family serine protease